MLASNKIFQFLILFCCLIFTSCFEKMDSENNIIYQTRDYEGIRNAILFIKSSGATVGDSYQKSILPSQNKHSNSDVGNIFVSDDPNRALNSDTSMIKLMWVGHDTLRITYNKKLRVFKSITKTSDAIIVYDTTTLK